MQNEIVGPLASLASELCPAPSATSRGRPWQGAAINWHDWQAGGRVTSPELDHDVIAMRTSGIAQLTQIRDGQTHAATVTAGNVTLHPRGMESSWMWDRPGAIVLMRMPPQLLQEAAETTTVGPPRRTEMQNCFGRKDLFVERILMQFLDELRAPPHPAQEYISQALSHALASHLVHRFNAQAVRPEKLPPGLAPHTLRRVQDYMREHIQEHIRLETLAGLANVSRFHFARMFRQSAGVSAMVYLESMRMERAQELIRSGGLPLMLIAALVGYEDQSYFTRRFRLRVGMTPAAYVRALGLRRHPS